MVELCIYDTDRKEELITVKQAALLSKRSIATIYNYLKTGKIKTTNFYKVYLYKRSFEQFLSSQ